MTDKKRAQLRAASRKWQNMSPEERKAAKLAALQKPLRIREMKRVVKRRYYDKSRLNRDKVAQELAAMRKKYHEDTEHRETIKQRVSTRYHANKEKLQAQSRDRYKDDKEYRESKKEKAKAYYQKNKEAKKAKRKEYYQANREECVRKEAGRRAAKRAQK